MCLSTNCFPPPSGTCSHLPVVLLHQSTTGYYRRGVPQTTQCIRIPSRRAPAAVDRSPLYPTTRPAPPATAWCPGAAAPPPLPTAPRAHSTATPGGAGRHASAGVSPLPPRRKASSMMLLSSTDEAYFRYIAVAPIMTTRATTNQCAIPFGRPATVPVIHVLLPTLTCQQDT